MEPILTTAKKADFSLLCSCSINGTNGTSNTLYNTSYKALSCTNIKGYTVCKKAVKIGAR